MSFLMRNPTPPPLCGLFFVICHWYPVIFTSSLPVKSVSMVSVMAAMWVPFVYIRMQCCCYAGGFAFYSPCVDCQYLSFVNYFGCSISLSPPCFLFCVCMV